MDLVRLRGMRAFWTALLLASFTFQPNATPSESAGPDYASHIEVLQMKAPKRFTITLQKPFVVIGDENPALVRQRSTNTVKWAIDMLKKEFFSHDPDEIIDVWLFRNKPSYEKHTRLLFDDTPDTPFGYYSPSHRALERLAKLNRLAAGA